jgi:hypothetical protein
MTKCAYDELATLTEDAAYHRALEELFVLTSSDATTGATRSRGPGAMMLAVVGAGALVLVMLWAAMRQMPSSQPAGATANMQV